MEIVFYDEHTIQHQYDSLAKKVLKSEALNCRTEKARRSSKEILFSEIGDISANRLYTADEYTVEYYRFNVCGYEITVKDELLGQALKNLSEDNLNVILMSYFLDMSDEKIGNVFNVVRSTIFRQRKSAISKMKKYMGDE